MKLFSKRHNLRLDDAAKRERARAIVGMMIIFALAYGAAFVIFSLMAGEKI